MHIYTAAKLAANLSPLLFGQAFSLPARHFLYLARQFSTPPRDCQPGITGMLAYLCNAKAVSRARGTHEIRLSSAVMPLQNGNAPKRLDLFMHHCRIRW
jgi:hypothetical protein